MNLVNCNHRSNATIKRPLFGTQHPDREFAISVAGGGVSARLCHERETWLYMHSGGMHIAVDAAVFVGEGCGIVVEAGVAFTTVREAGSVGLVVTFNTCGNKQDVN